MTFKPKIMIAIFLVANLSVYVSWAFIVLSFTEPIIETFTTENSRGLFLLFEVCIIGMGAPYYLPFEEKKQK